MGCGASKKATSTAEQRPPPRGPPHVDMVMEIDQSVGEAGADEVDGGRRDRDGSPGKENRGDASNVARGASPVRPGHGVGGIAGKGRRASNGSVGRGDGGSVDSGGGASRRSVPPSLIVPERNGSPSGRHDLVRLDQSPESSKNLSPRSASRAGRPTKGVAIGSAVVLGQPSPVPVSDSDSSAGTGRSHAPIALKDDADTQAVAVLQALARGVIRRTRAADGSSVVGTTPVVASRAVPIASAKLTHQQSSTKLLIPVLAYESANDSGTDNVISSTDDGSVASSELDRAR